MLGVFFKDVMFAVLRLRGVVGYGASQNFGGVWLIGGDKGQ